MGVAEIPRPTIPHALPPGAIADAAAADLRRRAHNQLSPEERAEAGHPGYRIYAFDREDVRSAASAADLVDRALQRAREKHDTLSDWQRRLDGRLFAKKSLNLICGNLSNMADAIGIARERYD